MHVSWSADSRPTWRVRSLYTKHETATASERLDAAVELEEALRATGMVRRPWVTFDGGAVTVSGLVKAESEPEAALNALELVEAVCAVIDCWLLGDLVRQTIQSSLQVRWNFSSGASYGA